MALDLSMELGSCAFSGGLALAAFADLVPAPRIRNFATFSSGSLPVLQDAKTLRPT